MSQENRTTRRDILRNAFQQYHLHTILLRARHYYCRTEMHVPRLAQHASRNKAVETENTCKTGRWETSQDSFPKAHFSSISLVFIFYKPCYVYVAPARRCPCTNSDQPHDSRFPYYSLESETKYPLVYKHEFLHRACCVPIFHLSC